MEFKLLAQGLLKDLEKVQQTTPVILKQSHISILLCRKLLTKYRREIVTNGFESKKDEIIFFKEIKQVPLFRLIYYKEVLRVEKNFPKGSDRKKKKFIEEQLMRYQNFFSKNFDFGQYIESQNTHFDEYYFTRKFNDEFPVISSSFIIEDVDFNTPKDVNLGQLRAYMLMVKYLNKKRASLRNNKRFSSIKHNSGLVWTGSYAAFVELTYGLKTIGVLNNGATEIKRVIEELGDFLGVSKGNHSRTYNEIKSRKSSRVKFFDKISESLLQKMDDEDGLDM